MKSARPGALALKAAADDARRELFGDEMTAEQKAAHDQGLQLAHKSALALRGDPFAPVELLLLAFARCGGDVAMQWGLMTGLAQALRGRR
jgi:hypothetical protein